MGYEIYRAAVLQQATAAGGWEWTCQQWKLSPDQPAYGVVYVKDEHGQDFRLITTDVDFVRSLPADGPCEGLSSHEWMEIRPEWFGD
jgi:hypothetical protein